MTRISTTLALALVALMAVSNAAAVKTKTYTHTTTVTQAAATKTVQKLCSRAVMTAIAGEARAVDADDAEDDGMAKRAHPGHPHGHPTVRVTVTRTRTKTVATRTVTAACAAGATGTSPGGTSAAPAPTTGSKLNNAYDVSQPQELVGIHNVLRAKHGANAVVWDQTLADFALQYASQCNSGHSGHAGYGENLAFGAPPSFYSNQELFNLWANEQNGYDYSNNNFNEATGHFTQAVWKSTTAIGCAVVTCPAKYGSLGQDYKSLTCEYTPQGNVQGQFVANVGPPQ